MNYFIITYGCQMNVSDSERIAAVLEKIGHKPAPKIEGADLIVVNMCSVRQSAVDRVYGLTQKLKNLKTKKQGLKTILTGCILKSDRKKFKNYFDLILGTKDLQNWPKYLQYHRLVCGTVGENGYLSIQPKYQNNFSAIARWARPFRAFIPISNGCNNACVYCVVPFTRGPLVCRDHREILKEVKNAVQKRFREIWLLGQNVNDYIYRETDAKPNAKPNAKLTRKINFAKLIKMVNDLPGEFKFFFTSPHPKNFSDELIKTLAKCEKFGKYLNLPVQSGDNEILKRMNRNYTIEEYKNLVKRIREKIPDVKLSTDVIVGFPGETKRQFQNTVKLFKEIKFDNAYIAKYSPRPGTAAFKMENNVSLEEKKRREKILREIIRT